VELDGRGWRRSEAPEPTALKMFVREGPCEGESIEESEAPGKMGLVSREYGKVALRFSPLPLVEVSTATPRWTSKRAIDVVVQGGAYHCTYQLQHYLLRRWSDRWEYLYHGPFSETQKPGARDDGIYLDSSGQTSTHHHGKGKTLHLSIWRETGVRAWL
jgi:hypothetical protein